MGNRISGLHIECVIARARKRENSSSKGFVQGSVHSRHMDKLESTCFTFEHVLKKIDSALDSVIYHVLQQEDGMQPTVQHGEANNETIYSKENLVDIVPSKRYLYDNTLFLCKQSVVEITPSICRLRALRIIQGCCNTISQLPAQICLLKNLRSLILSNNQIRSLPDDIGECTNLKEIDLSNNCLISLPVSFSKLSRLCALDIAENRFCSIPMCISSLNTLQYLNVEGNHIKAVPIEILRLKSLVKFRFNPNPFVFAEGIKEAAHTVSLMELCARKVFLGGYSFNSAKFLIGFVRRAKKCSFCGGPFYKRFYKYTDTQNTIFGPLPVCYRLCSRHFDTKKDKIMQALLNGVHCDAFAR
eukprot:jgi/Antlo1/399/887